MEEWNESSSDAWRLHMLEEKVRMLWNLVLSKSECSQCNKKIEVPQEKNHTKIYCRECNAKPNSTGEPVRNRIIA